MNINNKSQHQQQTLIQSQKTSWIYMRINKSIKSILTVLILFCSIWSTSNQGVNSFNLLLPTSYHPTKGHARQIIITSGGCYDWESTQSSVVRVKGTHHGLVPSQTASKNPLCNSNGIVELVKDGQYPSSVYITARDRASTELINIPVRIRDLKRISIFTKSKVMNIKEIQNLEIFGFDSENNTFTSLQGLRFKWRITDAAGNQITTDILTKIPLSQSNLYLPFDTRKKIQSQQDAESDLFVVQANRVGKVYVRVRCMQPSYQMISDQITLYIQQKFELSHATSLNLLAGSTFQFNLLTLTGQQIPLPSQNYNIKLTNPSFTVDQKLLLTAPMRQQNTILKVSDVRTDLSFNKEVDIFSYQPDFIQIVFPQEIVIGDQVRFQVKYFNKKRLLKGSINPIWINVQLLEDRRDKAFELNMKEQKIKGIGKGSATIKVEFNGVTGQKRISSMTPLKLINSKGRKVVLPVGQIYQLSVIGGSGAYKYTSALKPQQQSIFTTSYNGLVTTRKEGTSQVIITDQKNPNNRLQVKITVIKMGRVSSLEQNKQFNIYEESSLYITGVPRSGFSQSYYTECNDALLRGLAFQTHSGNNQESPLQLVNTNPINYQTLSELHKLAETNRFISKLLKQRSVIPKEELLKQYEIYIKYDEIKRSQLDRILDDMQNYGLCTKALLKPISLYDGQIVVKKGSDEYSDSSSVMRVRIYDKMANDVEGLSLKQSNQVILTPLTSFKWRVRGGPYKWNIAGMGDLEVYINGIKMDGASSQNYLQPVITCPSSQKQDNIYTLKYRNPASQNLLRPVQQQKRITVQCRLPDLIRLGLPQKTSQKSTSTFDDHSLKYLSSNQQNSTIYLLPGQSFKISCQPIISQDDNTPTQYFYNATNVKYQFINLKHGTIQQISHGRDISQPRTMNTRIFTYNSGRRREVDIDSDDIITIVSREVVDPRTRQSVRYPREIRHNIVVKTIQPIKLMHTEGVVIDLPNIPNSQYVLKLEGVEDSRRFSIRCQDNILKCSKNANSQIIISPRNIDRTTLTNLTISDEYAISTPQITIPVKVKLINGVDLYITRTNILQKLQNKQHISKTKLQTSTRIFDGDQFVVVVDVYSLNIDSQTGRSGKQSLVKYDLGIVQIGLEKSGGYQIREISRVYDEVSHLAFILFKMPRIFGSKDVAIGQPEFIKVRASIKHRVNEVLTSNPGNVQVYNSISLQGSSLALPYQQLQIGGGKRTLARQVDAFTYIMESCSNILTIQGGPPQLKTKIVSNPSQGQYYNIIKLTQRKYKIQTIKTTLDKSPKATSYDLSSIRIQGKQRNLLSILVYIQQSEQDEYANEQIGLIRCLILIAPIRNIHIVGNDQLLSDRHVRYLVEFGQDDNSQKMIKEQCSLKYQWSVEHVSRPVLYLTSDSQKIGVNVTTVDVRNGEDGGRVVNPSAEISVVVFSKKGREIGRHTKRITVLFEEKAEIIPSSNPNSDSNQNLNLNSNKLILIPPNSSLKLSRNLLIQQVSNCQSQYSPLTIKSQNQIHTESPTPTPQLIKLTQRTSSSSSIPTYAAVLVTDICTAVIQNVDGGIAISPVQGQSRGGRDSLQLVRFQFMDCQGRKFLHYNFRNLEYRVTVTDTNVATASIYNPDEGLIRLEGHHIGQAQLILQVILGGIVKAKDIVPISVNIFIQPSKPVSIHIGDIINFKAPNNIGDQKWSSSDQNIIKINQISGRSVGFTEGEAYIKLGAMSTRVSVVKITDFVRKFYQDQGKFGNGYEYQIVYSGKKYPFNVEDQPFVRQQLQWKCQVLGEYSKYLRAIPQRYRQNGKDYIRCRIEKIPGTSTVDKSISTIRISVGAHNQKQGFIMTKQFDQALKTFMILSERSLNPRDPKFKKQKNSYQIKVQTSERLNVEQTGGRDSWIISNQFNGARQLITLDLSQYKSGEWLIHFTNPRTKQTDYVVISTMNPTIDQSSREVSSGQAQKDGWKWTDLLVLFMAVNFLAILGYQIWQSNSFTSHSKVY